MKCIASTAPCRWYQLLPGSHSREIVTPNLESVRSRSTSHQAVDFTRFETVNKGELASARPVEPAELVATESAVCSSAWPNSAQELPSPNGQVQRRRRKLTMQTTRHHGNSDIYTRTRSVSDCGPNTNTRTWMHNRATETTLAWAPLRRPCYNNKVSISFNFFPPSNMFANDIK
jgi:hypothetical protein